MEKIHQFSYIPRLKTLKNWIFLQVMKKPVPKKRKKVSFDNAGNLGCGTWRMLSIHGEWHRVRIGAGSWPPHPVVVVLKGLEQFASRAATFICLAAAAAARVMIIELRYFLFVHTSIHPPFSLILEMFVPFSGTWQMIRGFRKNLGWIIWENFSLFGATIEGKWRGFFVKCSRIKVKKKIFNFLLE